MTDDTTRRGPGRPSTGITPKRGVRIGPTWDRAEQLEHQLAAHEGRKPNMTRYVERALERENARAERTLRRVEHDDKPPPP